jgi:homoserine O-acetyltransferase
MTAITAGHGAASLPSPFGLERGGHLRGGEIVFETWGQLTARRDNAILIFTGLSASAHARSGPHDHSPGWWEDIIGPGLALDTDRYYIVCINSLGSCFGSTGPRSIDPETQRPYGGEFPELSLEDIARGGRAVLQHLDIETADTVLGVSLGGMVALAYLALFPHGARHFVSISATMAASPYAIALRSLQREAVIFDPRWRGGNYSPADPPKDGLALARKLGTVTYRSAQEFATRFGRRPAASARDFAIEDYLAEQAQRFIDRFDANSYVRLSRAMDLFDLSTHGSPSEIFRHSALRSALIVGVDSDHLFALDEQKAIADALTLAGIRTHFEAVNSLTGHDAFLAEPSLFAQILADWFSTRNV